MEYSMDTCPYCVNSLHLIGQKIFPVQSESRVKVLRHSPVRSFRTLFQSPRERVERRCAKTTGDFSLLARLFDSSALTESLAHLKKQTVLIIEVESLQRHTVLSFTVSPLSDLPTIQRRNYRQEGLNTEMENAAEVKEARSISLWCHECSSPLHTLRKSWT